MHLIEHFSLGKRPDQQQNEDAWVITPDYAFVFDGATSKIQADWPEGATSARFAAQTLARAVWELPPQATLAEAVVRLSAALYREYVKLGRAELLHNQPVYRPSAALAGFSKARRELWLVGDCQAMVGCQHYQDAKHIDTVTAEARAAFLAGELQRGASVESLRQEDPGWAFIQPLLQRQMDFQNKPFADGWAYGVMDGFEVPRFAQKAIALPADAQELVLASDGYSELYPTLSDSEAALHAILQEDPLCMRRNKQAKGWQLGHHSFDDRTYLRLRLSR